MALTDNLLSYWKLEESSGTRNDEVGSNDLTDSASSVGSATGIVNNGAEFVRASNEFLGIAHASQSPDLSISGASGDITIASWVKLASKPATAMSVVAKYGFANGNREYYLWWDNVTDRFLWRVFNSVATSDQLTASSFGAPSTSTWYFLVATVDNTANTISISVNDGTMDSTALTVTTHNGGAIFYIGAVGNASPIDPWDGVIDEVGVWSRVLTASEITELYNSGAGLTYPFSSGSSTPLLSLMGVGS